MICELHLLHQHHLHGVLVSCPNLCISEVVDQLHVD